MRLIDTDEFLKRIEWLDEYDFTLYREIKKYLDEMPTIDAEPVRHGHWIYCRDRYADHKQYQCSECGKHMWTKDKYLKDEKYCFKCGAKMDEVKNETN